MSIIFGYINFNQRPAERSTLETMKHAMDFWGPDGEGIWIEGTCGLGNLLYYNTPEALFEKLPITDDSGNLVMTAGARIDNRDELFRIFDIPLGRRLTMPDSSLMLLAYKRWGEACADHLIGDWAMAIWDKREQKLFLARDHHGITALYYYKGEDFFVFSSSLKGILCLPQVPKKVNEYKIARLLVNRIESDVNTCYSDIMRLLPAHTLALYIHHTQDSFTLKQNRYWFLENTPEVHLKNNQEYMDKFLDLYTEAVRCRLRSHRPVGATLSSGLDSGSVCILAARELAKQGKRLQAYTAVPLYDVTAPPNRIGNEGPLAMALAEKLGNLDLRLCKSEKIEMVEEVERMLQILGQPNFGAGNAYWLLEILQKCQNDGNGTLLIGESGNGTVSWPPSGLLNNTNFFLDILRNYKNRLKLYSGIWKNDFLLNNEAIRAYKVKEFIRETKLRKYHYHDLKPKDIRMQILMPGKSSIGDIWQGIGTFFKIETRDPTSDLRLLKFLIGLPDESSFANNRKLFCTSFEDYFSDELLQGKKRGVQSIDMVKRFERQKSVLSLEKIDYHFFSYCKLKKIISNNLDRKELSILLMVHSIQSFIEKKGQFD